MKLNPSTNRVTTPFGDFQIDVDNLFDHVFGREAKPGSANRQTWSPRVHVTESETEYQMQIELPGVNAGDVSLEMKDNHLIVAGSKQLDELADGIKRLRDERLSGEFERVFEFSQQVDSDRIEAEFKNGILAITLPKSETVLPRKIEIKVTDES